MTVNADFHGRKSPHNRTTVRLKISPICESNGEVVQPRNRGAFPIQPGLPKDRIVAPTVESDHDPSVADGYQAGRRDELAEHPLRRRAVEPLQVMGQPAVAAVGQHRQGHSRSTFHRTSLARQSRWKKLTLVPKPSSTPFRPA